MKYVLAISFVVIVVCFLIFNPFLYHENHSLHHSKFVRNKSNYDFVITVKTTKRNHGYRVKEIVDTWFQLAPSEIFFVTDTYDAKLNKTVGGHLINSHCPVGHHAQALVCKLHRELRVCTEANPKWCCHFDDDNYVNIPKLKAELSKLDENEPFYLGKTSTGSPITIYLNDSPSRPFWFGTGGAGVCLSRAAINVLRKTIVNNHFRSIAARYRLPDDMTLGFVMENVLNVKLTQMEKFHSHIEPLNRLTPHQLLDDVVFGASENNLVSLPWIFEPNKDPLKFRALHCFIFDIDCPLDVQKFFNELRDYQK